MEHLEEDLFVQLQRTLRIVQHLENQLRGLNESLQPLEERLISAEMGALDIISTDDTSKTICVVTPILQIDPLVAALDRLKAMPNTLPRIFRIEETTDYSDRTERTLQILLADLAKKTDTSVIILRWAHMIPPLENKHTVVIGTRYLRDPDARIEILEKRLQAIGLTIVRDNGLYGGGRLCHNIITGLRHHSKVAVAEITLAFSVVNDPVCVKEVLRTISELSR